MSLTQLPPVQPAPLQLVAAAQTYVGFGEASKDELGLFVESVMQQAQGTFDRRSRPRWDAAFVHHVGYWSQYRQADESTAWPIPYHNDLNVTARWARGHGLVRHAPSAGDLFMLWSEAADSFVRIGIVAAVLEATEVEHAVWLYDILTIEGDSGPKLELGGGRVMRHKRQLSSYSGDLFIDWTASWLDREVA